MTYKKSRFNSVIEAFDDGVLIFNTMTAAILWIPNELWEYEEYSGDITEEWEQVIDSGIWVECNINEIEEMEKYLKISAKKNSGTLAITIVPTYACNMKCDYCFQHDYLEPIMSYDTADKILASLMPIILKYTCLHVTWFGGEPMLALEVMEYLSQNLIEFCTANSIKYTADLITNGTLLNNTNVDILKQCCVMSVQITLDGTNHDEVRKMKDGSSSYQIIINNIAENVKNFNIVVRSNVTESNTINIKNMIDELMIDYNLAGKVFFSFYPVSDFEGKKPKCDQYNHLCGLNVYDSELIDLCSYVTRYQSIRLVANMDLRPSTIPCEAICKDAVCLDAHGDVYKCALSMQNMECRIGNIFENSLKEILDDGDQKGWLTFKWEDECKECKFLPMCHSGCIFRKRVSGKTKICALQISTHKQLIKLLFDEIKKEETDETVD